MSEVVQKASQKQKVRIPWIDYAKSFLIITVILYHSFITETWKIDMHDKPFFWVYVGSFVTSFNLPAFFFLSGFLYRERHPLIVLKNSAKRLFPPYIANIVIWTCVFYSKNDLLTGAWSFNKDSNKMWQAFLFGFGADNQTSLGFTGISYVGAIWFFLCMFIATNLFNLLMYFTQNFKYKEIFRPLIIATIYVLVDVLHNDYNMKLPWTGNTALSVLVIIYFGYKARNIEYNNLPLFGFNTAFMIIYTYFRAKDLNVMSNFGVLGTVNSVSEFFVIFVGIIWIVQLSLYTEKLFVMKFPKLSKFGNVFSKIGLYSGIMLAMHQLDLQVFYFTTLFSHFFYHDQSLPMALIIFLRIAMPCLLTLIIVKIPYIKKVWGA